MRCRHWVETDDGAVQTGIRVESTASAVALARWATTGTNAGVRASELSSREMLEEWRRIAAEQPHRQRCP